MSTARDHLVSAARLAAIPSVASDAAAPGAAGIVEAPSASLSPAVPAAPTNFFYSVDPTPDGRFAVVEPDGLTIVQYYTADEMELADARACELNTPLWLALKPRGLVGYEPPPAEPVDSLMLILDKPEVFA